MAECGVCLHAGSDFGDNGFEMWTASFKTPMQCCECGRIIPAGEPHEKARYYIDYDRKFITQHTCAVCAEIAWAFFCDVRLYENLWDYMQDDAFPELTSACFNKLKTAAAKAELQRRWMEWKGLATVPITAPPRS